MTARAPAIRLPSRRPIARLRRSSDFGLSLAMGLIVAALIIALPMKAALASSIVGAFVILALVDTRVAVLALLLVRSSMDVTATVPLLSASGSANVNAAAMMSFLAIGIFAAHVALSHIDLSRVPLAKPMGLVLAIAFVGIAMSPAKMISLQDWIRVLGGYCVYVLVVDLMETREQQRWLVRVLLASALAPVTVGIWQYVNHTGNTDTPGLVRIYGTFTHPSPYSFYLVQMIPLAAVFFVHTRSKFARLGLGVMIPAMLFCVFEAQTRGAWVGLIVSVAVFSIARARWTLIFIPLVLGAAFFGVSSVRARVSNATSTTGSVMWREHQWQHALGIASAPKLATVGTGLGAVQTDLGQPTHNEYLRMLVETGLLGLIVTLALYVKLWRLAQRAERMATDAFERDVLLAFLMAFAGRAVIALSDNVLDLPALEWYFWAAAGLAVVMGGSYQRRRIGQRGDVAAPAAVTISPEAAA